MSPLFNRNKIEGDLNANGYSTVLDLLSTDQCMSLKSTYSIASAYRKRIVMAQHGFGRGEYKYFDYPLPHIVEDIRAACYAALYPIANRWHTAMKLSGDFPPSHHDYLKRCHSAGQTLATPLILSYRKGDYNCLHQDLYGEHVFPLQLSVLLSSPGRDFEGGEFILVEQGSHMQSRSLVVPLGIGDGVIFPVRYRPEQGAHSPNRVNLQHGVSRLTSGKRYVLGVNFHDAC
ncbi:MAG TPA: proline hydroxylase [Gammaproteobacteria bacterium]|nr:proline hydroxylase [Gammaproteobacteria bacterium]|tara:strand:- start:833 stop:1525 length:693 start_codon:yes stop_codon:yes gene_type:complete